MKIIGLLLIIIGVIGIILTVMMPALFGYGGLIAGVAAILTGIVFLAACCNIRTNGCERRHHDDNNCCC
ncbi:MAG: hypothetical protein PUC00_10815 [Clostridiales bacterium]|nr:hypothetical protein [Clostridiales bacterium]